MRMTRQKFVEKHDEIPQKRNNTQKTTPTTQNKELAPEPESIEYMDDGKIYAMDQHTGREIRAAEIDQEYFQDTGEIVVLEWEFA